MQAKALDSRLGVVQVSGPSAHMGRAKRIDLVVTDYEFPDEIAHSDGLQHEVRCTIPLAILNGSISSEALYEAVGRHRPWTRDPISTDDFLHLVENVVGSLCRLPEEPQIEGLREADHARIKRLTPRERQVLEHVVAGDPNKRTAAALNISRRTVEHHRAAIMQKTQAKSVSELVRLAMRTGLFAMKDEVDA